MSVLSAAQAAAVAAGAPIRQKWLVYVPQSSGSASFDANTIHDTADPDNQRVTKAGSRRYTAWNVSIAEPGQLTIPDYRFEVDNSAKKFYPGDGSLFENSGTSYNADPQECYIVHQIYVKVAGEWSEITGVKYTGEIVDVEYWDGTRADGVVSGRTAMIHTRAETVYRLLMTRFDESHGTDKSTGVAVNIDDPGT